MLPVLPLLRRNYENNLSPAALRGKREARAFTPLQSIMRTPIPSAAPCGRQPEKPRALWARPQTPTPTRNAAASGDGAHAEAAGRVAVAELDWSQPSHYTGGGEGGAGVVKPPFDYILAADCVYHEHLLRDLYRALLALSDNRTTILVANERRSESVQAAFTETFSHSFTMKRVRGVLSRRRLLGRVLWKRAGVPGCLVRGRVRLLVHGAFLRQPQPPGPPPPPPRQVPHSKMAEGYSHPAIELTILKRKKEASLANVEALEAAEKAAAGGESRPDEASPGEPTSGAAAAAPNADHRTDGRHEGEGLRDSSASGTDGGTGEGGTPEALPGKPRRTGAGGAASTPAAQQQVDGAAEPIAATTMALASQLVASLGVASPPSFEERRAGSMAARLLSDVRVPPVTAQREDAGPAPG